MARVPAPVTVITTIDADGRRRGFTGTSFTSLSLRPPLVLVCIGKSASTHRSFTGADHFMINLLSETQEEVARRFARSGIDRFKAGDMTPHELGLPGLAHAAARLACATHEIVDAGDHSILIGRVEAVHVGDLTPLVYWNRRYVSPTSTPGSVTSAAPAASTSWSAT